MRLRIHSDGTPMRTVVVDLDTGAHLDDVVSITWSITATGYAIATIVLDRVAVDVEGETA